MKEPLRQSPKDWERITAADFRRLMQNYSYRSLEHLCRRQAALSAREDTKKVLQEMAREYQQIADYVERQQPTNEQE